MGCFVSIRTSQKKTTAQLHHSPKSKSLRVPGEPTHCPATTMVEHHRRSRASPKSVPDKTENMATSMSVAAATNSAAAGYAALKAQANNEPPPIMNTDGGLSGSAYLDHVTEERAF